MRNFLSKAATGDEAEDDEFLGGEESDQKNSEKTGFDGNAAEDQCGQAVGGDFVGGMVEIGVAVALIEIHHV